MNGNEVGDCWQHEWTNENVNLKFVLNGRLHWLGHKNRKMEIAHLSCTFFRNKTLLCQSWKTYVIRELFYWDLRIRQFCGDSC